MLHEFSFYHINTIYITLCHTISIALCLHQCSISHVYATYLTSIQLVLSYMMVKLLSLCQSNLYNIIFNRSSII